MGNVQSKEDASSECIDNFVRHLLEKQGYILQNFEPTTKGLTLLLDKTITPTTILQLGGMYVFRLCKSILVGARAEESTLLDSFIKLLCRSVHPTCTADLLVECLDEDSIVYVACLWQPNWCTVMGTLVVKFQDCVPVMYVMSSHTGNTEEAMDRLDEIKDTSKESACLQLQREALTKTRLSLGIFLIYFALRLLASSRYWELYKHVMIESSYEFVEHYEAMGFALGADMAHAVPVKMRRHQLGRYDVETTVKMYDATVADEWKIETGTKCVRMHYNLTKFVPRDFLELVVGYKPNIIAVLDSHVVFTADCCNVEQAIREANCVSSYFSI